MISARPRHIATLLRHELRMILRDRRTVVFSILLPLAVMPVILLINNRTETRRQRRLAETVYSYSLSGSQADMVRDLITTATHRAEEAPDARPKLLLKETETNDPVAALESAKIHFFIEALAPGEGQPVDGPDHGADSSHPRIRISYRADRDASSTGTQKMHDLLERARTEWQQRLLQDRGLLANVGEVSTIETNDIATSTEVAGAKLGKFLTALVMMFVLMGGSVVATDSIAGEKERGTLETLLTTALGRDEIVISKLLAILAVALIVTFIQAGNLLVYVGFGLIPIKQSIDISLASVALVFVLLLPAAALASSVLLLVSGRASSYKEAQLYFFPVFLIGMLVSIASVLPGMSLRSAVVLVPIANTSVAVREVLVGVLDWPFLLVGWMTTAVAAVFAARASLRSLSSENLIVAAKESEVTDAEQRFSRDVLRWIGVLWAVMLVAGSNIEALATLERQVLFNVVLLFGGGSWLMIRRYRLDHRKALALRLPHPAVWIAVVVGAPAGAVVTVGLFRLASLVLPVPTEALESFSELLLPESLALWKLLLLVALLPGIFEEILFRGMLVYGLRRRLHPVALCLVVALTFGLFHIALFRLVPTTFLGIMLTALTLLSGSILPAMLWHAANNTVSIIAAKLGIPLESLGASGYAAATLVLVLSFWIVYRCRRPYPGLRPWRRSAAAHEKPGK
jgi:sodium transport system permease protein